MKKVVIVTGGSRGIGAATSKLLASNGYSVCVNYRSNQKQADEVISNITESRSEASLDVSTKNEKGLNGFIL